eukprot:6194167-Pleurochrysis_carterae.AAC.3
MKPAAVLGLIRWSSGAAGESALRRAMSSVLRVNSRFSGQALAHGQAHWHLLCMCVQTFCAAATSFELSRSASCVRAKSGRSLPMATTVCDRQRAQTAADEFGRATLEQAQPPKYKDELHRQARMPADPHRPAGCEPADLPASLQVKNA